MRGLDGEQPKRAECETVIYQCNDGVVNDGVQSANNSKQIISCQQNV